MNKLIIDDKEIVRRTLPRYIEHRADALAVAERRVARESACVEALS